MKPSLHTIWSISRAPSGASIKIGALITRTHYGSKRGLYDFGFRIGIKQTWNLATVPACKSLFGPSKEIISNNYPGLGNANASERIQILGSLRELMEESLPLSLGSHNFQEKNISLWC